MYFSGFSDIERVSILTALDVLDPTGSLNRHRIGFVARLRACLRFRGSRGETAAISRLGEAATLGEQHSQSAKTGALDHGAVAGRRLAGKRGHQHSAPRAVWARHRARMGAAVADGLFAVARREGRVEASR